MGLLASLVGAALLVTVWVRFERKLTVANATITALAEQLRELTMRVDAW